MTNEMPPGWENQVPPGPYGQPGYPPFGQAGPPRYPYPAGYGAPGPGARTVVPAPGGVPLRPLSLGDILNGTVTLARRNPAATFGLTAIVMTIYGVIEAVIQRLSAGRLAGIQQILQTGRQPTHQQVTSMLNSLLDVVLPALLGTFVLALLFDAVLTGLLSAVIGRGLLGRQIGLAQAWRAGRPGAVLGASVLLLLLGVCVPLPVVAAVVVLAVLHLAPVAVLLGVIGAIGCVVFEILLVIRLSLTLPAVVLEGISPVAAIRRSWQLSSGSFWRLLGILLLTGLVVGVASYVLTIPFALIAAAAGGSGGLLGETATTSVAALIITTIGTILAATVTRPISAGVSVLLYADLRMRREGLDLRLRDAAQEQSLTGEEFGTVWLPPASGPASPAAW